MALPHPHKPSPHHRKLRGEHHRHSKEYLKTYAPYLPLLMLAIIGLAINTFWTNRAQVLGATTNLTSQQLLESTNQERSADHEDTLKLNERLSAAAQSKANDMAQHGYWSHNSPTGQTPWTFIQRAGYEYQAAGENLAYGFPSAHDVMVGWMNSPGHRANILNTNYQEVGFGVAAADNFQGKGRTTIVVAMYGEPADDNIGVTARVIGSATATISPPARNVSRIQMLTGGAAPWSLAAVSLITLLGIGLLLFRHAVAWHRLLVRSEAFIVKHKTLDVFIVMIVVAGIILTRAVGFIG